MKKLSTLLLAAVTSTLSIAQTDSSTSGGQFKIIEARISAGMTGGASTFSSIDNFKTLTGNQSTLLNNISSNYNTNPYGYSGSGIFSLQLGWIKKRKKTNDYNNNRIFRLGIDYYSPSILFNNYSLTDISRTDTLISSQNGSSYYVDSVTTDYYNASYNSSVLQVTFSAIYSTSQAHQVTLYGGLEGALGITFNNYTSVTYFKDFRTRITFSGNLTYDGYNNLDQMTNSFSEEIFGNKTGFTAALGVPLGIDLRLGKKRDFWKKLHLFYEVTPAISVFSIPELNTFVIPRIKTQFGLRVTF